jgi:hypothetical protein
MATVIQFIPFSEEERLCLGGELAYDVALGNYLPQTAVKSLGLVLQAVLGEAPAGDYADVMRRFEKRLRERIESGENITDLQLTIVPYIPGRGLCPLPAEESHDPDPQ